MNDDSCSSNHADYLRDTGGHLHFRKQKEVIAGGSRKEL